MLDAKESYENKSLLSALPMRHQASFLSLSQTPLIPYPQLPFQASCFSPE